MAKGKKGFMLYADLLHTVDKLPNETAGILFKHILSYVNDLNPSCDDLIINIAFEPIKQQLKRDLLHWESVKEKRSMAGKESANKRQQMSTHVESVEQTLTKSTVIVKDNVNVKDIINTVFSFEDFWSMYPNKVAKSKCQAKYKNIPEKERQLIKDKLPNFIKHKPFETYNHPNPETYINQKRWEDVIEVKTQPKPIEQQPTFNYPKL